MYASIEQLVDEVAKDETDLVLSVTRLEGVVVCFVSLSSVSSCCSSRNSDSRVEVSMQDARTRYRSHECVVLRPGQI